MGRSVVKQPNGKFALFSSIVDDFVLVDATKQELIDSDIEEARERITAQYDDMFEFLDKGETPPRYVASTMSWEEAMEQIADVHGGVAAKQAEQEALGNTGEDNVGTNTD